MVDEARSGMNAIVVNCSSGYNLAALQLKAWLEEQGASVLSFQRGKSKRPHPRSMPRDLDFASASDVFLSAIFSWDLPLVATLAGQAQGHGCRVHVGGPAAEANADWIEHQTGISPWRGPHPCACLQIDEPLMTWTSRGCPNRCPFCIVPAVEGDLVELDAWQPASKLMDNNILACSPQHQERVIARLAREGFREIDFNQGLDAHLYTPAFRRLLERYDVRLKTWRFSYDLPGDWAAVQRALRDLHGAGVGYWDIAVYVLYGWRETPEEALERVERVIGSREEPLASPWPMAFKPLDWMTRDQEHVNESLGWTQRLIRDVRRYYSRPQVWKSSTWNQYDRNRTRSAVRQGFPPNWDEIARRQKDAAGWKCEHCGHPHDPEARYTLEVHHVDGDRSNNTRENLVALCQRCHLRWENGWSPGQAVMPFARPDWMVARGLG